MVSLDTISRGFRSAYLDCESLTAQLEAWRDAYPELVRLTSLAKTPEGRDLWLLTIGRDPDRVRPTAWIDGNMHANELAGSSVALAIAEDVLRAHLEPETLGLPAPVLERVRAARFFVMPRMSPDGAECVLKSGRYVRSVPRDERVNRGVPRWRGGDIDGDGVAMVMRKADPTGDYVAGHAEFPDLLVTRELADAGPYYRIYPEGTIDHFDGFTIPAWSYLHDNPIDLNRQFPWSWAPHHEQIGAGPFPGSEVESRAVIAWASAHPEIFAWLNLHTYGGVFIRPLLHAADVKMDQDDLGLWKLLGAWAEADTGYPMVSGYEEFLYVPDTALRGDLVDFAYEQRGAIAYAVELWDLFKRAGIEKPKKKFADYYGNIGRAEQAKLAAWDRDHNQGRVVRPWKKAEHPQLGEVEVGGIDPRIGIWNPPYELLDEVCRGQSAHFLKVAALAPQVNVRSARAVAVGDGVARVEVVVDNTGYLPTYILSSAKKLDWNEPLYADVVCEGCELVDAGSARVQLGHLEGWGRGVGTGANELAYQRSGGNRAAARGTWVVRGHGVVRVRVGSCRVGFVDATVEV